MQIGSVNNNIPDQNPYGNKVEDQQNQSVSAADKTSGNSKTKSSTTVAPLNKPRDEYIPNGDEPENSTGVYQVTQDEDGKQKIIFDRNNIPEKSGEQPGSSAGPNADQEQPEGIDRAKESDGDEKKQGTVNTDKVDREIKKLKEEKKKIEQELNNNQNDEEKCKQLEKRLSQVESELKIKDNDAYRRRNATSTSDI